jgi:polar amino acid transport system substrate-binding protein
MKTLLSAIVAATVALALTLPAAAAGLPDLKGRTIIAVTENAYTPLNFADPKTGKGIGWEYDAMNEIAKRLDAKVDWKTSSWDVMIQAVHDGQYDIGMDGITINAERKAQVDFSAPYMTSQEYMLVKADNTEIKDPASFKANAKLLVGAQAGTTNFYTAVDMLGGDDKNPRIKLFDTFGASVQALKTGDVDLVLMDQASANGYIGANPGAFKTVGQPIGSDQFGFIFKKGSDLVAPVDAAIASMQADGTLEALNKKWFFDYMSKQ